MLSARTINLDMVRGDTLTFAFEVGGIDHLDTAFFSCKVNATDDEYTFQKSLGDGISAASSGKYRVRVAPEDTEDIDVGAYYYDLEIGVNSDVFTLMKGRLRVEQDITRH